MSFGLVVLLAACGGDGDDGGVGGDAPNSATMTAKQICVSETNKDRATVGKPPVQESAALEAYADTGAIITSRGSGLFRAACAVNGPQQFYRIERP